MNNKLYGIISAIVTPMNSDESINHEKLVKQIDRMIASGIHGIFCLGTNGEFYALTYKEKLKIIETTVKAVAKRVPVYAGVGCTTTRETIELAQQAQILGADIASIITPYFGQVNQEQLFNHYKTIAENIDLPILLYNIPARTGNSIECTTLERLAAITNIIGIKDSSGNFDNILKYLEITNREFPVLSGNDSLILYTLMAGGHGAVSGCANIFPYKLAQIYELFKKGEIIESLKIQDSIRPIRNCLSLGNPNSIVKYIVNLCGHDVGPARSPFNISTELDEKLLKVIETYNLNEWN